jgi:hypothetical protein
MFCLKHSAELECYGKGGLSKPRCTRPGCDGEHTPGVHMLMGEDNAGVNLIAGDEDEGEAEDESTAEGEYKCEYEYEDGGWWVGTVGMMETPEGTGEAPCTNAGLGPAQGDDQGEVRGDSQVEWERDFQVNECSEGEMAGDEWWDLEPGYPSPEEGGARAPQTEPPQHPLSGMARHPARRALGGRGSRRGRGRPQTSNGRKPDETPGSGKC